MKIALGIVLLIMSIFLIVAVLMQSGKSHNLSGAIAGGAETFFGKEKGKSIDKLLSKLTTIVAIIFVLIVVIVYVVQEDVDYNALYQEALDSVAAEAATADDTAEGEEGNVDATISNEDGDTADVDANIEVNDDAADEGAAE